MRVYCYEKKLSLLCHVNTFDSQRIFAQNLSCEFLCDLFLFLWVPWLLCTLLPTLMQCCCNVTLLKSLEDTWGQVDLWIRTYCALNERLMAGEWGSQLHHRNFSHLFKPGLKLLFRKVFVALFRRRASLQTTESKPSQIAALHRQLMNRDTGAELKPPKDLPLQGYKKKSDSVKSSSQSKVS